MKIEFSYNPKLVYKLGFILAIASSLTLIYFWALASKAPVAGLAIQIILGTGVVGLVLIYIGVKGMLAPEKVEAGASE